MINRGVLKKSDARPPAESPPVWYLPRFPELHRRVNAMNHLAHFLLCPVDDEARAGTLIADFARGNDLSAFTPNVELGIRLHRRVDALTDASAQVISLKPLVEAPLRRYAGILFDVFFDCALLREWAAFHPDSAAVFKAGVYTSLARSERQMPEDVRSTSARMRAFDALSSCATHAGCARTLARISARLKRPVDLSAGIETLVQHEARIVATLHYVLPGLQRLARTMHDPKHDLKHDLNREANALSTIKESSSTRGTGREP